MIVGKQKQSELLDGAYEEPGVIGTRIEIEGDRITILWRNTPALETTFRTKQTDGGLELRLAETGLRNRGDERVYATVTRLLLHDDTLEFERDFPISGPSKDTLKKTELSRYGNVTIVDEVLNELQGEWVSADGNAFFGLTFRGNEMTFRDGRKTTVHAVRPNGSPNAPIRIIDADPSVYEWHGFGNMTYEDGTVRCSMFVCDAPSVEFVLIRRK